MPLKNGRHVFRDDGEQITVGDLQKALSAIADSSPICVLIQDGGAADLIGVDCYSDGAILFCKTSSAIRADLSQRQREEKSEEPDVKLDPRTKTCCAVPVMCTASQDGSPDQFCDFYARTGSAPFRACQYAQRKQGTNEYLCQNSEAIAQFVRTHLSTVPLYVIGQALTK